MAEMVTARFVVPRDRVEPSRGLPQQPVFDFVVYFPEVPTSFGNQRLRPHCELLDAVVLCVCNIDATVGGHCNAIRVVELPVARALRAPYPSGCTNERPL